MAKVEGNDAEALRLELEEARDEAELNLLQLQQVQQELEETRDEAELILLQLQQVQEELNYYFVAFQEQEAQLKRYAEESRRAEGLIAALLEQLETRG